MSKVIVKIIKKPQPSTTRNIQILQNRGPHSSTSLYIWEYMQINMAAVRTPYISDMLQCNPTMYPTEGISVSKIYFGR